MCLLSSVWHPFPRHHATGKQGRQAYVGPISVRVELGLWCRTCVCAVLGSSSPSDLDMMGYQGCFSHSDSAPGHGGMALSCQDRLPTGSEQQVTSHCCKHKCAFTKRNDLKFSSPFSDQRRVRATHTRRLFTGVRRDEKVSSVRGQSHGEWAEEGAG